MNDIVDAHHHIWRQADMPWLVRADAAAHLRPLRADPARLPGRANFSTISPAPASSSPSMCRPTGPRTAFEDEVAWVQRDRGETGWPHAIVGYADVTVDESARSSTG